MAFRERTRKPPVVGLIEVVESGVFEGIPHGVGRSSELEAQRSNQFAIASAFRLDRDLSVVRANRSDPVLAKLCM